VTDNGWDHHSKIGTGLRKSATGIDKPLAGLLTDLKARGLLEDTLVVVTGEFGRTPFDQSLGGKREDAGRDHNPNCWTMFMAGAGVKQGLIHGETDEYGWKTVNGQVHVHDLHATILHLLGLDHERLTYRYSGRDFRLTDVYGKVVREVLG
jgi:arylsulfatase A-like enzyme